jgi:hypothetical protein
MFSLNGRLHCKTSDFHRKLESLYHRDSPWISGYRVQNVSQIITQSHTSHHIRVRVHNLLHVQYRVQHYKPLGWIRVKFYATVASISKGSPSFILLATDILERSDASLSRTIHRRCCRTRTRTMHTQNLSPRNGIRPRHQLYAALSGLLLREKKRQASGSGSLCCSSSREISTYLHQVPNPKALKKARNHLVTQGPVSITYSYLRSMRELPLLAPQWLQSDQRGRWSLYPLTDCNHGSPYTHL